jgi:hypothetical protein
MASVARVLFSTVFLFNLVFNLNGGTYVLIIYKIYYAFYINMMLGA